MAIVDRTSAMTRKYPIMKRRLLMLGRVAPRRHSLDYNSSSRLAPCQNPSVALIFPSHDTSLIIRHARWRVSRKPNSLHNDQAYFLGKGFCFRAVEFKPPHRRNAKSKEFGKDYDPAVQGRTCTVSLAGILFHWIINRGNYLRSCCGKVKTNLFWKLTRASAI